MLRRKIRTTTKIFALVTALGLCVIAIVAALSWHRIVLRYHLYHLSHGPCPYRDSAFRYLLQRSSPYAEDSMRVDEVVVLPQKDGGDALAIFEPDVDDDTLKGERTTWLFDREPTLICFGEIQPGGMKDLTGDGVDELLMECHLTSSEDRDFNVFLVLSTNRIRRPLLVLCCEDDWWSCQARQDGSLGTHNIEISRDRERIVTFRWSPVTGSYVGPDGGHGEPYARLKSLGEISDYIERVPARHEPSQAERR